jgi:hypothetical protein
MDTDSVMTANGVTSWLDGDGLMPTVVAASGSFTGLDNQSATFTSSMWNFNSSAISAFWAVDGFTFDLISSNVVVRIDGSIYVTGTGRISGNGFDNTLMSWFFSTQDDPANHVFSFSGGGEALPDGGATVALLGLSLAGIEGIRRKVRKAKS